MTKLTEWQSAMLEKLVADEMERGRKSGWSADRLNDLATLKDTLETADALHVETFQTARRPSPKRRVQ